MATPQQGVTAIRKGNHMVFGCHSDTATAVFLAGSFNNWSPTATPMTRDNRGQWTVSLPLAPRRYEYKFVVDGEWNCEPGCAYKSVHCPHCVMNEFGTMIAFLKCNKHAP